MGLIELRNIHIQLQGKTILEEVNLTVEKGEFVALIGPNGAGKTTILKVILGLLPPTGGQVLLFSQLLPLPRKMRHLIGYLPQRLIFDRRAPLLVRDVVLMGRTSKVGFGRLFRREDYQAVEITLERAGIGHLAERPIGQLSGGQQQLVFLARAIVGEPEILLLDEPTTGLDIAAQARFYQLVKQTQREMGLTVLGVSHDLAGIVQETDRLIAVNKRILATGAPDVVVGALFPQATKNNSLREKVQVCWS
ncbi:MAG: metal ABC transporter ATP-binding protein [Clostridia bacterium]|nr:metal ABC transporter ATP-binding protein [Clostridia bacterium]